MLNHARLVAMLPITRPEAALAFYLDTLGLVLVEDTPFALVMASGDTTVRLQKVEAFTPHPFTALGWAVADIRAAVRALAAKGVAFERYAGMQQDELGIWSTPGGFVCWFKDPEGNLLSLSQAEA